MPVDLVEQQLQAVVEDIPPAFAKTGALGSVEIVEMVARQPLKLVVDPVIISKHGSPLMSEAAQQAVRVKLLPASYLITPNLHEAAALTGREHATAFWYAHAIADLGARRVLIKGGHGEGPATDVYFENGQAHEFTTERLSTKNTHGTGCTFSAAITAELAKGTEITAAIDRAKRFIFEAIRTNPELGRGVGPLNHHAAF